MINCILHTVQENPGKVSAALIATYAALVTSLPEKREDFNLYDYFYSVTHALLPYRTRPTKPNA